MTNVETVGPIAREIAERLRAAFDPDILTVTNDSGLHHGHAGDDGTGESHFSIHVVSARFAGKSRLERQRMVNTALGDLPGHRVHALAIKALESGE